MSASEHPGAELANIGLSRRRSNEWRTVRLGDVCRVVGGSTPKTGIDDYWHGVIVWVTPSDLGRLDSDRITNSDRCITQAGFDSCGADIVPTGSVVMSSRAPIGHLAIAAVPLCTNQGCKTFVPGRNVDSEFLYFRLKYAVPDLQALGSGATFAEVSKRQCEAFEIPLPPLPEQKRIAASLREQLDAAARMRAAAERTLDAAKALRRTHIQSVFESPPCSTATRVAVGEISSLVMDGPHVTPQYVDSGVPFITVRNIVGRKIDFSNTSFITPEDHRSFSRRGRAEVGDILYTKDGTLGTPCLVDDAREFSFFVSVALIKLRRELANPRYVAYALESPDVVNQVEQLGMGAGLKHMVLRSIRSLTVPMPPLEDQQRLADELDVRISQARRLEEVASGHAAVVGRLPAAVLRRAFLSHE